MTIMAKMANPTLLVLAAGIGSRYGGLKVPEPVGPGGEGIPDYSIHDARKAGFGRVILVIRREMEQWIKQRISAQYEKRLGLEYVYQELARLPLGYRVTPGRVKPWGTTHAILSAAKVIQEPFAVINAHDFYGAESYRVLAHHLQFQALDYVTVGFVLRHTLSDFGGVSRGICSLDAKGYLEHIAELKNIERDGGHAINTDADGRETRLTGDEIVSMNMWGFSPAIFPQLTDAFERFLEQNANSLDAECSISNAMNELLLAGKARVKVLRGVDAWFGVTYREDHDRAIQRIRQLIETGVYPKTLRF
jgi:dTDP-glucose pyrophosphorylase